MQHYSIGAVARITQIPTHTLRKWESRHGIAVPTRTDTGRRVYTQADIEQLQLIKQLVDAGHALRHLAGLDVEQLQELARQTEQPARPVPTDNLVLIGPQVSKLLLNTSSVQLRDPRPFMDWRDDFEADADACVVVETPTLSSPTLHALTELTEHTAKLIVVYSFGSKSAVDQMRRASVVAVPGPIHDHDLLTLLDTQRTRPDAAAPHRFSTAELARIASLNPGLQCECPNHIARLLMDISAFEQYSNECMDEDPAEAALHKQLGQISAQARTLFEDALVAVASADGLQLKVNG